MINFYIPNQKPGEKIILLVRRHWFILFLRMHLWILLLAVPPALSLIFSESDAFLFENHFMRALITVLAGTYYLMLWLFILNTFVDYYLDVWIVTNERILNTEQKQIFSRVTAEHELSKIQDVASEVHGILPTFLDYGDVHIQTASETQRFIFRQIPHPIDVKRKISSLCEYKKRYDSVRDELQESQRGE